MRTIVKHSSDLPPPLFKGGRWNTSSSIKTGGGVNFDYVPGGEGNLKIKKEGGSMVQGQVFLKGGANTFPI